MDIKYDGYTYQLHRLKDYDLHLVKDLDNMSDFQRTFHVIDSEKGEYTELEA